MEFFSNSHIQKMCSLPAYVFGYIRKVDRFICHRRVKDKTVADDI